MISTIPVWIILISSLLKIEKTNTYQIFGMILSLIGVTAIITQSNFEIIRSLDFNKGDLSIIIAMFSWAIFSTLLKKEKLEISQITLLQVVIIFGLIFLIPIYIAEFSLGNYIVLEMPFFLTLTYVVIFPGLLSFLFWIKGISIIGANRSGIFLHLMPIFGSIFNEKIMTYHLIGALFIIVGIKISNMKKV